MITAIKTPEIRECWKAKEAAEVPRKSQKPQAMYPLSRIKFPAKAYPLPQIF